jgi:hypothetical protein
MNTNSNSFVNASEERVEFQVEPATVVHNCVDGHHVYIDVPGVKPTCTEPGYTAGSYCVYCYQPEVASTEIPALGHTYVDGYCKNCGEKCPFIMGDTNADGTIDVKDIIRLMKHIAGVDIEIQGADVNGDGVNDYYFTEGEVASAPAAYKNIAVRVNQDGVGLYAEANPVSGYDLVYKTGAGDRYWYPDGRQYLYPIPAKVIRDYRNAGYTISQNPEWDNE